MCNFDRVQIREHHLLRAENCEESSFNANGQRASLITTKQRSEPPLLNVRDSLKRDIYRLHGTLKNLRMPACCYQLGCARKAETPSLSAKSTISEKCFFLFSHHLGQFATAGNSETQRAENDLVHFPDAFLPISIVQINQTGLPPLNEDLYLQADECI